MTESNDAVPRLRSNPVVAWFRGTFTLAEYLERCLLLAVLAGAAATLLLVARNGLLPYQRPFTFGLAFWMWYSLLLGAITLSALLASWIPGQFRRTAWITRVVLVGSVLVFAYACLWLNRRAVADLFALGDPARQRWLAPAAFVLSLLALLAVAMASVGRRAVYRGATLLSALATLSAEWPVSPPPRRSDFQGRPAAFSATPRERRLLVIAVDAADWTYIDALMARGELANFAALKARGLWARLKTFEPTASPVIWTSIATGRPPARHGVNGFTTPRLKGVEATLPPLRPPNALGFPFLIHSLERSRFVYEATVNSGARRVPAFWNVASAAGSPVSVVTWWVTWPAEPVLGHMVSDHIFLWPFRAGLPRPQGVTFPETLYDEVAPRVVRPEEVTFDEARPFMDIEPAEFERLRFSRSETRDLRRNLKFFLSAFETSRRISLDVMQRDAARFGAPSDHLVLFRLVDQVCHNALHQSELVTEHLGATAEDRRALGRAVSAAYRAVDRALGELLEQFGDGNVVVLSDHGFVLEEYQWGLHYNHSRAPDGILVAAGPAFQSGPREGLSVYEVLPLLMAVKGLPVSEELRGRVREDLLRPEHLRQTPLRFVKGYGAEGAFELGDDAPQAEAELMERLRALGYVQ